MKEIQLQINLRLFYLSFSLLIIGDFALGQTTKQHNTDIVWNGKVKSYKVYDCVDLTCSKDSLELLEIEEYDEKGRITRMINKINNGTNSLYYYGENDKILKEIVYYSESQTTDTIDYSEVAKNNESSEFIRNLKVSTTKFDDYGHPLEKQFYSYYENGKLAETRCFYFNSNHNYIIRYDQNGNELEYIDFTDGHKTTKKYLYDKRNNLIRRYVISGEENIRLIWKKKYNKNNKLVKFISKSKYKKSSKENYQIYSRYDSKGNLVKERSYYPNKKYNKILKFKYDSKGNLIKEFFSGIDEGQKVRNVILYCIEYEYYPD